MVAGANAGGTDGGPSVLVAERDLDAPEDPPAVHQEDDASRGRVVRRVVAAARARPLLVVAVAALVVAVGHGIWIWTHRRLGAYDPDEAGYIASSLRYQQSISFTDPWAFVREVGGTGTGPLVPLLSVGLLLIGPNDPRTVMLIQPLLMAFTAVAVAGIARRLAGPWAAITAGLVVVGLPTMISASVSYWLGLGAAAGMAGAVWALVESDRLTNRWTWAFGAGVAAMLLARSMAMGYVPAVGVAALVVVRWERRSLIGLAKAASVVLAVAVPWYVVQRDAIFGYLFSYGYGERSELFGEAGLGDRAVARFERLRSGVGPALTLAIVLVVAALVVWAVTRRRPPVATREGAAVAAVVVTGAVALMSTANNGVWFELPIVVVAVALVVAVGAGLPWPARAVAAVPVVLTAILQLGCTWWIVPYEPGRDLRFVDAQGQVAHYEWGFEQYDTRFGPGRRDELDDAAEEWWAVSTEVADILRAEGDTDRWRVTLAGNFQLFNANTVALAARRDLWLPPIWIPDTQRPPAERANDLTPAATTDGGGPVTDGAGRPVERILLLVETDQHLFTPDADLVSFTEQARASGWEEWRRVPMPDGSAAVLYRHPDAPER